LSSLESLFRTLRSWLKEGEAEGLFRLEAHSVSLEEPGLGKYEAPALRIVTPRGDSINVTPKARVAVGVKGRVDFECAPKTAVLVRTAGERWRFVPNLARSSPGLSRSWSRSGALSSSWSRSSSSVPRKLTEESFWETLDTLLS
jgi:hypothetical protein